MTDSGFILLRDLPSNQVQLDLSVFTLEAGERGFRGVPPGAHYVAALDGEQVSGFWCYVVPGDVLIRRHDPETGEFDDAAPALSDEARHRVALGTFDEPTLEYAGDPATERDRLLWAQLTRHIGWENFPPELNSEEVLPEGPEALDDDAYQQWLLEHRDSPFEKALFETHGGDTTSYLAELEYAFLRWMAGNDEQAFDRWTELLQGLYSAGDAGIARAPALFPAAIDVLVAQLTCLPEKAFAADSIFAYGAHFLAQDLVASGDEALVAAGQSFADYLRGRGVLP